MIAPTDEQHPAPRESTMTGDALLLDRLEYAIHLLEQVLESDRRHGWTNSAHFLEHELEHLRAVAAAARAR